MAFCHDMTKIIAVIKMVFFAGIFVNSFPMTDSGPDQFSLNSQCTSRFTPITGYNVCCMSMVLIHRKLSSIPKAKIMAKFSSLKYCVSLAVFTSNGANIFKTIMI